MPTKCHKKFYSKLHVTHLHNFFNVSEFDLKYLKNSFAYLFDIYVLFDQIGDAKFKNEVKTGTGSSFTHHFGENQISEFSRPRING